MNSSILVEMARDMGLLPGQLETIVRTAPLRYKVFYVPKRTGGRRQLAQPAKEVKWLQYWLINILRPCFPVHSAASAYEAGCSIRKNAAAHSNSRFLLKMDFSNFFPSITESDFKSHIDLFAPDTYSVQDLEVMSQILFWAPDRSRPLKLCIGAPSSPMVSNSIMYCFDSEVERRIRGMDISYTRYADDLTFSAKHPNQLGAIPEIVRTTVDNIAYPRLRINDKKTVHASRATQRIVTGIVITPSGELSVGRERKRLARSMFHRASLGLLDDQEIEQLNGLICFIESIEPGFRKRLSKNE